MYDIREDAAKYYDVQDNPTADIPFYKERLPSPDAQVLEIGCGTGRVLLPLAPLCAYIQGIEPSPAMLARCQEKLDAAGIGPERAQVILGDAANFDLGRQFDLIIAPFRVFQLLETDAEVDALFERIHRHLAPGGRAILNTFNPNRPADELRRSWVVNEERPDGETLLENGKTLKRLDRRPRIQSEPLVIYPELIYRLYDANGELENEAVLKIAMRCWYADELERVVTEHGFHITGRWGGYSGETWGEGPELVIEFSA